VPTPSCSLGSRNEADRAAADAVGAHGAASALARVDLTVPYLNEWWPEFYEQAERSAKPTTTPFAALGRAFAQPIEVEAAVRFTHSALSEEMGTADTHPSLRHRLEALGVASETVLESVRQPVAVRAAERYLGALYSQRVQHFDSEWAGEVGEWWEGRYDDAQAAARRLEALDAARDELDDETLLEYAGLVERSGTRSRPARTGRSSPSATRRARSPTSVSAARCSRSATSPASSTSRPRCVPTPTRSCRGASSPSRS
jgi:hypothetical protein